MELREHPRTDKPIEFNRLSVVIVAMCGVSKILSEIDCQRTYGGNGLVYEALAYATGEGFKEVFSEWGVEFQTAQEFRQRHITAALKGIYG